MARENLFWGEHTVKRTRAVLSCLLVLATVVATPRASAAACQYTVQDLPVPVHGQNAQTTGSSTDSSRIVGFHQNPVRKYGLLWVNGTLTELPSVSLTDVIPAAVNNVDVVVGRQEYRPDDATVETKAFRYENGGYTIPQTEPGEQSSALGVNDAGDVVGIVWQGWAPYGTVVVWPRTGPRKVFGDGYPRGIDDQRRIVVTAPKWPGDTGWVIDTDTGARTELPGAQAPMVFKNGRVLNFERLGERDNQITEWDLTGARVGAHAGGLIPYGRNNSGTVFGTDRANRPTLWHPSGRTAVVADQLPKSDFYAEITAAETLIGTYVTPDRQHHPALWVCG